VGDGKLITHRRFEEAARGTALYKLALYVAGATRRSERAIANLRRLCEERLEDRFDLEVIDIYQQVERAREADIIGTPTLIRMAPLPVRRVIGDLSDEARLLRALGLEGARG
jgi:circadian clock protein KaiB